MIGITFVLAHELLSTFSIVRYIIFISHSNWSLHFRLQLTMFHSIFFPVLMIELLQLNIYY